MLFQCPNFSGTLSNQLFHILFFKFFTLLCALISSIARDEFLIAMQQVLQGFGVHPDATCGHSFGEFSALCAAGWIDLDDDGAALSMTVPAQPE